MWSHLFVEANSCYSNPPLGQLRFAADELSVQLNPAREMNMSTPPQGEASSGNSVVTYSTFWSCEIFEVDNHADIRVPQRGA